MGQKLVVGPFNKGLRNDVTPFNIDNESFPKLLNAYQWRGRVKRKRGTSLLVILQRFFNSNNPSYGSIASFNLVGGAGNLITGFALQTNANIVPGTLNLTIAAATYTDPNRDGTIFRNAVLDVGSSINYSTGAIVIAGGGVNAVSGTFNYYPSLPVMGLEDLILNSTQFPGTLGFDTKYSYNITTSVPATSYDVSFYKNPPTGTPPGYTQKANWTPTTWNGQNYQQFWSTNYENAFWVTNGIDVPFTGTTIGLQFRLIEAIPAILAQVAQIVITNHGLVDGDFIFVNEVNGISGINFQTGYIPAGGVINANSFNAVFPQATLAGAYINGGIVQYLTNRSNVNIDCIRWYDGDPTLGNPPSPTLTPGNGWVNFMPPLSSQAFSISGLPPKQYYLAGARMIVPFKDRLCFFGPVVQASTGVPIYLQDTVIYSQNGTPYYTASFTGDPLSATTVFTPILVPTNQIASPVAYVEDSTGFGGFQTIGIQQPILTVSPNQDVLMVGLATTQTKMVFTGNDVVPFNFFITNSELGSASTFSAINLDQGVMTRGNRGFVISNQVGTERFDLEIPDEVFEIKLTNNGSERVTAQRDFINEWVYFTYPLAEINYNFPTQTLQYNYRDNSWAVFRETYTTYGQFKFSTGITWATVGASLPQPKWSSWNSPWNSGSSTVFQPDIIAGNQQGFVFIRAGETDLGGTDEANSLTIQSISGNVITSINHCLNTGDYISIHNALGTVGWEINGRVFSVGVTTTNTFQLNPAIVGTGTYFGGGQIQRMYVPLIQTKQFPAAWDMGRKTRIGAQQYLLTTTEEGQIQLQIYLNQNADLSYNLGNIVPEPGSINNSLIYSTVLYTCPESANIGLTPANNNLQMPTAIQQQQIWHRVNTSLIGDTIQLGFTMSDTQMRTLSPGNTFSITGATQDNPCVLTCLGGFPAGSLVTINGILGMTQLNTNTYVVLASDLTTVTIGVDSIGFDAYLLGGFATLVSAEIQFDEIELHGFNMELSPSQMLS